MFAFETGSGTPVILLHGFGMDHTSLLTLEPVFERSGGWRRIYLDLPGATRTPVGDVRSTQGVADAVVNEIRERVGDEDFAVLGNSFGGMIARHVAHELRDQVLGLATIAGVFVAPHAERGVPERTVLWHDPLVESILGSALTQYREGAVVESEDGARAFLEHVLPGLDGADQPALDRIAERYSLDSEPELAHPDPFVQPSLHLTARQDHVVGYTDAWSRIEHYPRATFATLDAAGHDVMVEQTELCAALIGEWLGRVRRP